MEYLFKRFDNIKQFNTYLKNGKTQKAFAKYESSQTISTKKSRDAKTHDFDEADKLLMFGDVKTARGIEDAGVADVRAKIAREMPRRQTYSSVVGFAPNVPAYLTGCPNSMINQRTTIQRQKVLNIAYSCAVSYKVKGKDILEACSRLLSAILKIEASGTRVNLYLCSVSDNDVLTHNATQRAGFSIKIKSSGEKLDVLKVAYPMVHPSMNRRHKFRFLEITEGIDANFADGYGRACEPKDIKEMLERNGVACDIALNYYSIAWSTIDGIVKQMQNTMNAKKKK